jgi:amino acid adenylation domain-containing protein/thioester reductase-like protein
MQLFSQKRLEDVFDSAAHARAHNKIIETSDISYTYEQITSLSDALAKKILERNLTGVVALFMNRSIDLIISILAVLKADLAYIAIDPTYPQSRVDYMMTDLDCKAILTHFEAHPSLEKYHRILIPFPMREQLVADGKNLQSLRKNNTTACILYTSGSTGNPKPVTLTHAGILNLLENQLQYFHVDAKDKILQFSSVSFDAFIAEMWIALLSGAVLVLPKESYLSADVLADTIIANKISFLIIPPSVLDTMENVPQVCASLRTVISVGEALTSGTLHRWRDHLQHLINAYGPSETTVCATFYEYQKNVFADNLIGKPLDKVFTYVLDEHLNQVAQGEMGELCIGGAGLSPGYFNHPELDVQRFIQNPFDNNQKLYKTGDLCRYVDDGNLQYVGRADRQIKINGIRVELEEIENNLAQHDKVNLCAVKASEVGANSEKKLIAYFSLKNEYQNLVLDKDLIASLREHLSKKLPNSIIPHHYILLTEWPRLPSGKIDRNSLPEFQPQDAGKIVQEDNGVISLYAQVLQLDVNEINNDSDFFDLGGSSLSAIRLVSELRKKYEIDLPIEQFFTYPCVKDVCEYIKNHSNIAREVHDFLEQDLLFDFDSINNRLSSDKEQLLLTGVTGFLGSYLLSSILKYNPDAQIHCLIRVKPGQTGIERLRESLKFYNINDVDLNRVSVYHADLSLPELGLSTVDYEYLSNIIGKIYHCAAAVNHLFIYNALRETNVLGAIELIKFSTKNKKKDLEYVSTMDITLLKHNSKNFDDEKKNIKDKMGYIQTKWVAEYLFEQASRLLGLNINIYRPGNIIGDLLGGTMDPNTNHFLMLLKGCIQLGYAPDREIFVEMTPVNLIADAITQLSMQKRKQSLAVYPLHNPHAISWKDYINILIDAGISLKLVDKHLWANVYLSGITSENTLFPFKDFYMKNQSDLTHGLLDYQYANDLISLFKSLDINHPSDYQQLCTKQLQQLRSYGFL